MERTNECNVHLARRRTGDTVIEIETTGTTYELKVDGITKMVATEKEAKALLSGLTEALGLEYFLSAEMLEKCPGIFTQLEEIADKL